MTPPAQPKKAAAKMVSKIRPEKDWFTARFRAMGATQLGIAERMGIRKESLGRLLTGARDVSAAEAAELAAVLQTSVTEIMRRLGLHTGGALTLSGRVLHDGRVSPIVDTAGGAPVLGDYPVDAIGLLVEATEGPLAAYSGADMVYRPTPARSVGPDMVGRLCVIEDAASPMPVVGVLEHATGSHGNRITVFGTGEVVPAKRLLRASPVLGIHLRAVDNR